MRDTSRSLQRKIMCFSAPSTGRLIWLPELRGWLRLATGEDVWRTQEGGRTARGGDSVARGKSLCQWALLKAGSLKAAAPALQLPGSESGLDPPSRPFPSRRLSSSCPQSPQGKSFFQRWGGGSSLKRKAITCHFA